MSNPNVSVRPSYLLRRVALELGPKPQNIYKKKKIYFGKVFSVHVTVKAFSVQFFIS